MRAAAGGGGSGAADRGPPKGAKTTFKYICIPADESLKPEELVGHGALPARGKRGGRDSNHSGKRIFPEVHVFREAKGVLGAWRERDNDRSLATVKS